MTVGSGRADIIEKARALYERGDFERCRELALDALADSPDDARLLQLAGNASVELGRTDAADYLERAVSVAPDDLELWQDLADALLEADRHSEATTALRRTVTLRPDDAGGLIDLAHAAYAAGRPEEAVEPLNEALERDPANPAALRALVEVHRRTGRTEDALAAARQLAERSPDDVLAQIDIAELSLALDRIDDAVSAYARLREIHDDPEHEIYSYHGMIQAEIRRDRWRRALELAIDATRVDRLGRTTDVLAYVVAQVFGVAARPAPPRSQIDAALVASQAEHRRTHEESLVA